MFRRLRVLVVGLVLVGCHDIRPTPTSPAPSTRSNVATRIQLVSNPGELPIGGGSLTVKVAALGPDGFGVSTPVTLSVDGGELSAERVITDSAGYATASWQGTKTVAITASAGDVIAIANVRVLEPIVFPPAPPPPAPPPPAPTPPPTPGPEAPVPTLTVQPTTASVARNVDATFTVQVRNLAADETVVAYQWDFDTATASVDSMTLNPAASHGYSAIGTYTVGVTAHTSAGRDIVGTGKIIVTN